jgi:hypothetical protein
MPEVKRMSKNWLNLRFSVGIVPLAYLLVILALVPTAFELARLCFVEKNLFLFEFLDETLFSPAEMKESSVAWPLSLLPISGSAGALI